MNTTKDIYTILVDYANSKKTLYDAEMKILSNEKKYYLEFTSHVVLMIKDDG